MIDVFTIEHPLVIHYELEQEEVNLKEWLKHSIEDRKKQILDEVGNA